MESFGRYELQDRLGQGGMGVVFRAFDTVLQRVVALKLVLTPEGLEPEMRERFFREARAAGLLTHKNIVTIYDLGEHDGKPYLAMEYLDGEDLQKRLARTERMSLRHKLDLAIEICEGVEFAHAHGVIHRDLKPANIFVTDRGTAKILDFGLARLLSSQLTNSNMMMGTLNYMAPEQVRGERAEQRSDVFSLGVVLYELLGGRKAFEGDSVASTLYKILQEEPVPLLNLDAALPVELTRIVERAMAKLRDERYQDVTSLKHDLDVYRQQLVVTGPITPSPSQVTVATPRPAVPTPAQAPRRSPVMAIVAVAAAVVVLALAGAWWVISRNRENAPPQAASSGPRPEDLSADRVRAAQQALDARQFAQALAAADAVLAGAPQHADAQRIRAAARRGLLDDAVARASRHLESGETSDAIKAAGEALAIAPDNEAARHILESAATRTGAADVEAARRRMAEARSAAQGAGADRLAPSALDKARRAAQEAERLFRAKRFGESASRFFEAGGLYRIAETAAHANAARAAEPAAPASEPAPVPATSESQRTAPAAPAAPAPPTAPPVLPQASSVPSPPVAAPVSPPAAPPVQAAPSADAGPSAEDRISELLNRYKEALEAKDLNALKRSWPSLGGSAENAIRQEFQHASQISVRIDDAHISVSGNSGKATFLRHYSVVTVEGQRLQSTARATMDVRRAGAVWVIDSLKFTQQ